MNDTRFHHVSFSPLSRWIALIGLSGFALAQPLFDLFGKTPEFFVIRRTQGAEIALLVIVLLFLLPSISILVQVVASFVNRKVSDLIHVLSIGFFTALIALPLMNSLFSAWSKGGHAQIALSISIGVFASLIYWHKAGFRSLVSFLSLGTLLFTGNFVYLLMSQGLLKDTPLGVATRSADSKPAPVFMIIFDEFPLFTLMNEKEEINEKRFPGFADLANHSTWFKNGTTVSSWTERAVPTIMSGLWPNEKVKQLPSLQHYPQNIFTLLSETHVVKGFEQVTHLCPDSICKEAAARDSFTDRLKTLIEDAGVVYLHLILPSGYKEALPDISFQWGGFLETASKDKPAKKSKKGLIDKGEWGDDRWLFSQFINSIKTEVPQMKAEGKTPFYLIHITFPHVPYRFLPDGNRYLLDLERTNDVGYKKIWSKSDNWPSLVALQRFTLQAGYADTMVADLLNTLREIKLFDESLIVVTADHGSSFQPGEFSRRVSDKNYMDVMLVPYFIKPPGIIAPQSSLKNVESVDVVSTILSLQNLKTSRPLDGISAFDSESPERSEKVFYPLEQKKQKRTFAPRMSVEPSLSRSIKVFGSGGFDDTFFSAAPHRGELLGATTASVRQRDDVVVQYDAKPDYSNFRETPGYLPVYISGAILHKNNEPLKDGELFTIALSVDGIIRTITQSEASAKGKAKFSGIIPPRFLNKSAHAVEALVIK